MGPCYIQWFAWFSGQGFGLHCFAQAFPSCGEWGLLPSSGARACRCGGFSCCRAQALGLGPAAAAAHGLSCPTVCGILVPGPGIKPTSLEL